MTTIANRARAATATLLAGCTLLLAGCWSMTALDTAKNPPAPVSAERWQLTAQLNESGNGWFDDTAVHHVFHPGSGARPATHVSCPYALTPNPVAYRKWFWNVFMPMPMYARMTIHCEGGVDVKLPLDWNKERLRQFARTWHQVANTPTDAAGLVAFGRQADAWRALPEKPALAESVRQYKVAAEAAVRDKQWKEAVKHYRTALTIDPLWPQGHFNVALLYAELYLYEYASVEMQKYLLLVPDAANARQAQDKIYEWQAQLTRAPN